MAIEGNQALFDLGFWKNPSTWRLPDGSYVPTGLVITTAVTTGVTIGVGGDIAIRALDTILTQGPVVHTAAEVARKIADTRYVLEASVASASATFSALLIYSSFIFRGISQEVRQRGTISYQQIEEIIKERKWPTEGLGGKVVNSDSLWKHAQNVHRRTQLTN